MKEPRKQEIEMHKIERNGTKQDIEGKECRRQKHENLVHQHQFIASKILDLIHKDNYHLSKHSKKCVDSEGASFV